MSAVRPDEATPGSTRPSPVNATASTTESESASKSPRAAAVAGGTGAAPRAGRATRGENRGRRRERKRVIRGAVFRAGRAVFRWLPLSVASVFGQGVGLLAWWAIPWMRRQTLGNLAIAYGAEKSEAERRRIGRRSYVLAGRGLFAWIVLHRMGAERATALVTPEISPEAAAVLDSGKGAIYLTQHSGLFELIGSWSAKHYGVVTVGRDAGADPGTTMLIDMRSEMGLRTIEQGSPREILRTLKDGGKVAMLADQDIRRVNGAFVPFFGRLAHTPTGPAAMAVRLKVPIVCSVAEWRSFTTHTARAVDVLWPREDLQGEDAVLELTARCSEAIERAVRRRPEEWLWMHDRWRASPADLPESPIWPPERRAGGGAPGPAGATNAAGDAAGDAKP